MAMFPAARKGDPITHDLQVKSGVIGPPATGPRPLGAVVIECKPAAHVDCTVVCDGKIASGLAHTPPPSPPPIVKGSSSVLIHGKPAARWTPGRAPRGCGVILGAGVFVSTS